MKTACRRKHFCRLFIATFGFIAACLMPCLLQGAGLAVFKQQDFHSNDLADIIVFASIRRDNLSCYLDLGTKEFNCPVSKIVETITVPSLPGTIRNEAAMAEVRQGFQEMSAFAARYKKAAPILKPYLDQFGGALRRLEAGDVLYGGRWISQSEHARIAQAEQEASDGVQQTLMEDRRKAAEAEQKVAQFFLEQRSKGLEQYGKQWLPKAEVEKLRQGDRETQAAIEEVRSKSVSKLLFSVLQVIPAGVLVKPEEGLFASGGLNVDVVLLKGVAEGTVAEGDQYRDDVYWCGTYTYATKSGRSTTVHAYSLNRDDAVARVRKALFAGPDTDDDGGKSVAAAPPPGASSSPLEGATSTGSGFFIGTGGHFVTNAHVVGSASTVSIYFRDKVLPAKILHVSKIADLAVLKTEAAIDGLAVGENEVDLGLDVYAIGFPNPDIQGIEVKVTKGVISSQRGLDNDDTQFQIDAAIQPGNSGGPLCDASGNLVGVVVSTLNSINIAKITGTIPQNVNYAIKASELSAFLRSRSIKIQSPATTPVAGVSNGVKSAVACVGMVIVKE